MVLGWDIQKDVSLDSRKIHGFSMDTAKLVETLSYCHFNQVSALPTHKSCERVASGRWFNACG